MSASRAPISVDRARSAATSGPSGLAPPLIDLADRLRGRVSLGAQAVGLALELAAARVGGEGGIDERGVLALVDRALADRVRLLAEPLQPDAHAATAHAGKCAARRGLSQAPVDELRLRAWRAASRRAGPFGRPRNAR